MKSLLAVVVSVIFVEVYSVTVPPTPITCYVGRSSGASINLTDFAQQECKRGESCRTDVVQRSGNLFMEKKCHDSKACFSQVDTINEHQCYSGMALMKKLQICLFCCSTDICNSLVTIPRPP